MSLEGLHKLSAHLMYVTAIVLAGGRGLRFNSKIPKVFIKIASKPIVIHCLDTLSGHPGIRDIIVVANTLIKEGIIGKIRQNRIKKVRNVVQGGKARQDSVRNGLQAVDSRTDLVLIHDGVRPFIDKGLVSSLIKEAGDHGAAIAGVPVKATIKKLKALPPKRDPAKCGKSLKLKTKFIVEKTLDRDTLWEVQTPQVFKKDLIFKAYKKFGNMNVTDDAALVEKLGVKVAVILGSYNNIKITTPEDLIIAEAIIKSKLKSQKAKLPVKS